MKKLLLFLFLILLPSTVYADLTNGLALWFKFDELSGGPVDSSPTNRSAVTGGTTLVKNCARSGCRSWNGTTSDFIFIDGNAVTTASQTLSCWIFVTSTAQVGGIDRRVLAESDGAGDNTYNITIRSADGKVGFSGSSVSSVFNIASTTVLQLNTWYHIVGTFDGSNAFLYVNGASDTVAQTGAISSLFYIGIGVFRYGAGILGYFSGKIDDVRIYNRVITAQERQELFTYGIAIKNAQIKNAKINF